MKADAITKEFISDTEVFADVFNYYVYGGQQVIRAEELTECDSAELALPYGTDRAIVPVEKYRDKKKLYTAMTDGKAAYILCGIENQTKIHYAMAVKNSLYDALCYAGQVKAAALSHRKAMKQGQERKMEQKKPGPDSGEFLGGFWKKDRLIPSMTLTVYFGNKEWDGPMSLFDMLEETDPRILSCINDYRIHLISPVSMSDEEIMKFHSSLREVLLFIKYSEDKENLAAMLESNQTRFQSLQREAAEVIEVITNIKLNYKKDEEVVDVCLAIQEMREESKMIGMKQGALEQAKESARNFYGMGLDIAQIAQGIGYPATTVQSWLGAEESGNISQLVKPSYL